MTGRSRITLKPWMNLPEVKAVMDAIGRKEARFVGGVVRDTLAGRQVKDIDIATTHLPEETMRLLKEAGIRVIPTGLKHGTVTAVVGRSSFEITTLRKDVNCDGRHAEVSFTSEWEEDAARRDFTINAMSLDMAGNLFDYFDGRADLKAGKIKFIGNADERIREDYLRILRFFRFHAYFGKGEFDGQGMDAIRAHMAGLQNLSGERIHQEMFKILAAPEPSRVMETMQESGVFKYILPEISPLNVETFRQLVTHELDEEAGDGQAQPLIRLAALLPINLNDEQFEALAIHWRFSNTDKAWLAALLQLQHMLAPDADEPTQKAVFRKMGRGLFRAAVLILMARHPKHLPTLRDMLLLTNHWIPPVFPVRGQDIIQLGVMPGKEVGIILREVEDAWEAAGYKDNRKELIETIRKHYIGEGKTRADTEKEKA